MQKFDGYRLLTEHFPDCAAMLSVIAAYGYEPPQADAARKWWSRKTIPGEWVPIILAVLEIENGAPVAVREYISK